MRKKTRIPKPVNMDLLTKKASKILDEEDPVKIARSFEKSRKRILKKMADPSNDMVAIQLVTLRALLRSALGFMAVAESTALKFKNERAIYGGVAAATMVRDLIADIGRLSDRDLLSNRVMAEIVDPTLSSIAQHFAMAIKNMQSDVSTRLSKTDRKWVKLRLQGLLESFLPLISESRNDIKAKTNKILEVKR